MNFHLSRKASDDVCLGTPEMKSGNPDGRILLTSGPKNQKNQRKSVILRHKEGAAPAD
jgi:hypothetical protein